MPANADSCASTEDQHHPFHCSTSFLTDEPSLRPELVSISTKNPLVVSNHHCVHANPAEVRRRTTSVLEHEQNLGLRLDVVSRELQARSGRIPRPRHGRWRENPERFLNDSLQVWEPDCLVVLDWMRQESVCESCIYFVIEIFHHPWRLLQVVQDSPQCSGCAIGARDAGVLLGRRYR